MNNWQETLLFPVRDAEARKQFLIACLVTLAGFIIPLIPSIILLGYGVRIMRQVITERQKPSMPEWQGSNWSEMLTDGLWVFGVQMLLMLPLLLIMGCGFVFMIGGSGSIAAFADENNNPFAAIGLIFFFIGIGLTMLFSLLSLPYGILISAALPHSVANNSFQAGFNFKEWFPIFRKGLGNFILSYVFIMVISFVFVFVIQIAMITLILMCIVPFLMIPYTTYVTLIGNTIYSQAYVTGLDALQMEPHATA
jgi:hypothetical protein